MKWIEVIKPKHQIENCKWVKCVAEIKCNETGEIRDYETDEILNDGEEFPCVFNWEQNNFSCDCNRRLFFKRVKGEETEADHEIECSDGQFSVNLKNKLNGLVYYREYST